MTATQEASFVAALQRYSRTPAGDGGFTGFYAEGYIMSTTGLLKITSSNNKDSKADWPGGNLCPGFKPGIITAVDLT